MQLAPSIGGAVARAAAHAEVRGPKAGLTLLDQVDSQAVTGLWQRIFGFGEPAEYEAFKKRVLAANNKGLFTPINHTDTVHIPGSNGGALFGGTAAEPNTGAVYVITQDNPGMLRLLTTAEMAARMLSHDSLATARSLDERLASLTQSNFGIGALNSAGFAGYHGSVLTGPLSFTEGALPSRTTLKSSNTPRVVSSPTYTARAPSGVARNSRMVWPYSVRVTI